MPRVQAGDVSLNYIQRGSGAEPVVFVHGYTSSYHNWDDTLPRLPENYTAYAFDVRGAGESDRPGRGYNIPQYAEDIHLATRALGLETFHYVGHSMGGVTGMQLALAHPERLRKLVLVAPAPADGVTGVDQAVRAQMKALRQNKELAKMMAKAFMVRPLSDTVIDQGIEDNLKWQDDAYDEAWDSLVNMKIGDKLGQISAQTLMVTGDRDFLRPDNLKDAARIPNCALQVFYRVGHLIPFDVPELFAALVVDFLQNGATPMPAFGDRAAKMNEMAATA